MKKPPEVNDKLATSTLRALFPHSLNDDAVLALGIRQQIMDDLKLRNLPVPISEATIDAGLRNHCRSWSYLYRIANGFGHLRVNLDGATSGVAISLDDARRARGHMEALDRKRSKLLKSARHYRGNPQPMR